MSNIPIYSREIFNRQFPIIRTVFFVPRTNTLFKFRQPLIKSHQPLRPDPINITSISKRFRAFPALSCPVNFSISSFIYPISSSIRNTSNIRTDTNLRTNDNFDFPEYCIRIVMPIQQCIHIASPLKINDSFDHILTTPHNVARRKR